MPRRTYDSRAGRRRQLGGGHDWQWLADLLAAQHAYRAARTDPRRHQRRQQEAKHSA